MFCEVKKLDAAMLARAKVFPAVFVDHNTGQIESNQARRSLDPDSQRKFRNPS